VCANECDYETLCILNSTVVGVHESKPTGNNLVEKKLVKPCSFSVKKYADMKICKK